MKAKYPGTCRACQKYHIQKGDTIVRFNKGWAKPECIDRKKQRDKEVIVLQAVIVRMRSEHGVVLAYWDGTSEPRERVFTRRRFVRRAKELGALNEAEERILLRHWHGILDRDLCN